MRAILKPVGVRPLTLQNKKGSRGQLPSIVSDQGNASIGRGAYCAFSIQPSGSATGSAPV